jgi:hypothetical protein
MMILYRIALLEIWKMTIIWLCKKFYFCNYHTFRYVNSIYYIITNATTIGYGDVAGSTKKEKTFLIFL